MTTYFTFEIKIEDKVLRVTNFPRTILINRLKYLSACEYFEIKKQSNYDNRLCLRLKLYGFTVNLHNVSSGPEEFILDKEIDSRILIDKTVVVKSFAYNREISCEDNSEKEQVNLKALSGPFLGEDQEILSEDEFDDIVFANKEIFKCYEVQKINNELIQLECKSKIYEFLNKPIMPKFGVLCNANFGDMRCSLKDLSKPIQTILLSVNDESIIVLMKKNDLNTLKLPLSLSQKASPQTIFGQVSISEKKIKLERYRMIEARHVKFILKEENESKLEESKKEKGKLRENKLKDDKNKQQDPAQSEKNSLIKQADPEIESLDKIFIPKETYINHKDLIFDNEYSVVEFFSLIPLFRTTYDKFLISFGCNKTFEACKKYNNTINFRGFPYITVSDL